MKQAAMANYNSRVYIVIKIALLVLVFLPFAADAHIGVPSQLVPCGGVGQPACEVCHLYTLAHNIIDLLLWGIATPLLVVALLAGGFFWLTSAGSEEKISKGKNILFSAVIGFIIAFGAWVIINTIMSTLVFKNPLNGSAWSDTSFCSQSPVKSDSGAGGTPFAFAGNIDDPDASDGISWEDGYDETSPEAQALLAESPPLEGQSWDQTAKNETCTLSPLTPYSSDIAGAASAYGVAPARLQGIIMAESSGNNNAVHQDLDGKSSYGLMQVRTDTARFLDFSLAGLTDSQVAERLRDSRYNIYLGAKYYSDLQKKYGNKDLASSAYNGGPVANKPSVNCPGSRRWQCEWDNDAHTDPNTGYNPTRKYIQNINTMESKISGGAC